MFIKDIPVRVWVLVVFLVLALIAINPSFGEKGIEIKSIETGSVLAESGVRPGQTVKFVNNERISTVSDFQKAIGMLENKPATIEVETSKGKFAYEVSNDFGFKVDENLTVLESEDFCPLQIGDTIKKVNSKEVADTKSLNKVLDSILPQKKLVISTDQGEFAMLVRGKPHITTGKVESSNIKLGLDLRGGTRVLLRPVAENGEEVTDKDMQDIISVLDNRLNVYGLSDMVIRSAKDWEGNKFIIVEIAGATREEVRDLIGKQGKFEAKIGNTTVFIGSKNDISFVCRGDGSCSGIRQCNPSGPNSWYCRFEFSIHLSPEAAKKHADATKDLEVILSSDGKEVLSKKIDFYLDGKNVDSLQIGSDLKGVEATAIAIFGPGSGPTKADAANEALKNMDKLQTILITGSLPFKLEIEKLDTISPAVGKSFVNNSILVGIIAVIAVSIVIIIRYKAPKIVIPIVLTCLFEAFLVLGFAALIGWNLDIVSIAGLIAAIGTGVNDQIIIVDEILRKREKAIASRSIIQRIKRAFFVIMVAYVTMIAAMIPLWNAGAGLVRGFVVTTIVGITMGVFITRPAFAAVLEKILKE